MLRRGLWRACGPHRPATQAVVLLRLRRLRQNLRMRADQQSTNCGVLERATFNPMAEHPGGCYTCRYFGERRDPAVWCAKPGGEHVRSQADRGCAFWEREPGADQ